MDEEGLKGEIELKLNEKYIREELDEEKLIGFVGNGCILGRKSGVCDWGMGEGIEF
ncbi:P-loop domain-containing protein [Staphylococcus pasteuri]|uniref:P-loop domain-containing protein n=1 Tax=Staphylococcus pasteuri TaxID=45972 RepID=UPI0021C24264|nr:P-loop domain-containing protein [Staphylococcus pasteuri]